MAYLETIGEPVNGYRCRILVNKDSLRTTVQVNHESGDCESLKLPFSNVDKLRSWLIDPIPEECKQMRRFVGRFPSEERGAIERCIQLAARKCSAHAYLRKSEAADS